LCEVVDNSRRIIRKGSGANLNAFIPVNRLQALTLGLTLPETTYGTILVADISGFTPLTEAFVRARGTRRGAEALTRQVNLI
jgi:hypothetical protein